MKFSKLALASVAALGLAGVAQADTELPAGYYVGESLEDWGTLGEGTLSTPQTGANVYGKEDSTAAVWFGAAADDTAILAYEDNAPSGSNKFPTINGSATTVGSKYLKVSNSSTLWRMLKSYSWTGDKPTEFPDGQDTNVEVGDGLFVDTLVQFTPSEDPPTVDPLNDGSKLVVWMNSDSNLCVTAAKVITEGDDEGTIGMAHFVTSKILHTNTWYRLTVKAYDTVLSDGASRNVHAFKVLIDGQYVSSDDAIAGENEFNFFPLMKDELEDALADGEVFFSLSDDGTATLAAVGFKGEGLVDDLLVSDVDPFPDGQVSSIDFTLTWGEGVSAVWYAIDDGDPVAAEDGVPIRLVDGKAITITADAEAWYAIDASSIPAQADLEDGETYEITATAATTGGAAGVAGDLAGFTADQLKTAFPDKTPEQINDAKNAYMDYQFGQVLNTLSAAPTLKIVDIAESEKTAGAWDIKVQVLNGETPLAVDNGSEAKSSPMRATLTAIASATLEDFADAPTENYELVFDGTTTDLTVTVPAADGQFFKAYIKYAVPANNQSND